MKLHPVEILIQKTLRANRLEEVLDVSMLDHAYRKAVRVLHPDVCKRPDAGRAMARLNELRAAYLRSNKPEDDAGLLTLYPQGVVFSGDSGLLTQSKRNFDTLCHLTGEAAQHFRKYLPKQLYTERSSLEAYFEQPSVLLSTVELPFEHVRWVLSRLLEFCAWMAQEGFVHAGIQPESVWIVPKTHGIIMGSFYHVHTLGRAQKSISARYKEWYPDQLFVQKRAASVIDLELSKRLAAYLLGSPGGSIHALQGRYPPAFIQFLLERHQDPFQCYDAYRKMLSDNFENQFYQLTL
jgi:hypothetical protein